MKAVDTNILARVLLNDDAQQAAAAARLLRTGPLFVPLTVMLELEWVLRGVARLPTEVVQDALNKVVGLGALVVEREDLVRQALDLRRSGLDFADALHVLASRHCVEFLTFDDRGFARKAARMGLKPPVTVPKGGS
ncbi:MAG: type II toxin-antitoxin system VapC family toxin [Betaproteobacteria bacterium]|nr:type II toxin-antitoxin system VapC family toxin [Betaproteobacteria bacterium]